MYTSLTLSCLPLKYIMLKDQKLFGILQNSLQDLIQVKLCLKRKQLLLILVLKRAFWLHTLEPYFNKHDSVCLMYN